MFCSACGKEMPVGAAYCPYCACPVQQAVPSQPMPQFSTSPFSAEAAPVFPPSPTPPAPGATPPPASPVVSTQAYYPPPAGTPYPPAYAYGAYPQQVQKRTTAPAKVLGLAFLLMGAAIAVSEIFYFIDRTRLLAGGGGIANSLILALASTVIAACAGALMLLCGSRLSAGKAYRGLAGLSAILYCAAKVLSIVGVVISTDFSNPAMNILLQLVTMVLYAGGMFLLWRIPVAWGAQDTAEAQTNANPPTGC